MRAIAAATVIVSTAGLALAQPTAVWSNAYNVIMMSSPRLADITGDATKEIVFGTMGPVGNPYNEGRIYVLDDEGNTLPGFPIMLSRPVIGPVCVADIDDDGDIELIAETWYSIYVWNHDGTTYPGWPKSTGTGSSVAPTVADLDGDGDLEVIAATGARLDVWEHDGTAHAGWPQTTAESLREPAVGDIDGDGRYEIVAGETRPQYPDAVPFSLHAWNDDGTDVAGFPVTGLGSVRGPVSLADLTNDGSVEIVARCGDHVGVFDAAGNTLWLVSFTDPIRNSATALGDLDDDGTLEIVIGGYKVHALRASDGTEMPGFPVNAPTTGNINSSPITADVNGDGMLEILVKVIDGVFGVDGTGGTLPGYPYFLPDDNNTATHSASPAVGDVDGDGDLEFVFCSTVGTVEYFDESVVGVDHDLDWPVAQLDERNTAFLERGRDCPPDFNGDGVLNSQDFIAFLNAFVAGDPGADYNGDGVINSQDFIAFLNDFVAGC